MTRDELPVGTAVRKVSGYPFPGEVRAVFTNTAGETRYVVETTGALTASERATITRLAETTASPDVREIVRRLVDREGYAGMLHIFSPAQIERVGHDQG